VICRLLIAVILACAALRAENAAPPQRFQITAELTDLDGSGDTVFRGHAVLREPGLLITGDEFRANNRTGIASAIGHVVLTRESVRLLADRLTYNRGDGSFTAEHVRLGSFPYYAEGDSASGTRNEITIKNARVTYGEPNRWQPTLTAASVTLAPGKRITSESAFVGIGDARPLPFPKFKHEFSAPLVSLLSLNGGYRTSLGVFAEAGLHLPVTSDLRLGGDLGFYSNRGLLFGPSGSYSDAQNEDHYRGYFRSGYINDHGDKKTDILGQPIPENRGYVEWRHDQQITDNLDVTAQLNWWKDSEVVRDFRPRWFFPVQEPDTFAEAVYAGKNFFVSAFGRFQPNSFEHVQERLPEIRFDLLPTTIGGGILEQFTASYARLREKGPFQYGIGVIGGPVSFTVQPNTTLQQTDRFDAYYGLSRPFTPTDWFTFTPLVGGRVTHYSNTRVDPLFGAFSQDLYPLYNPYANLPPGMAGVAVMAQALPLRSPQTRTLGELGFDAVLRTNGTFAYKNDVWKIDGLRHLFTPRLSYRYIKADKFRFIPKIDRPVFSTYLQPLGLSDTRAIDTQQDANVVRLAFDNVLQTRDANGGSRDLASLTLANDFTFSPRQRDLSGIQLEGALMPTSWLQLDAYQRYSPRHQRLDEFNTSVTLHDANSWSVRFSNNFLRHELDVYAVEGRARINEAFEVLTRLNYDVRKRRFNEQAYGLTQNLGNTWLISYIVSLYSGPRRESHFGFNVQIDTVRF
jgi:LPS-assembly protein